MITDGTVWCALCGEDRTGCGLCGKAPLTGPGVRPQPVKPPEKYKDR